MLYMVEMNFATPERHAEWTEWYDGHIAKLLSLPGFHAAQRLQAEGDSRSPYLALYEVDGPQVFESEPYRAKAGPGSTGSWRALMFDWHRNLFEGLQHAPRIPLDAALLVVDRVAESDPPLAPGLTALRSVGLDRTLVERGIAVMSPEAARAAAARTSLPARVFLPLMELARA